MNWSDFIGFLIVVCLVGVSYEIRKAISKLSEIAEHLEEIRVNMRLLVKHSEYRQP